MSKQTKTMETKIDVMIVGSQKAATTGLLTLLGTHPEVEIQTHTECVFFSKNDEFNRGLEWMRWKYFSGINESRKIITKDINLFRNRAGIERMVGTFPRIQIVTMIRNPVDRAYSAFWYNKKMGIENSKTFEEAISKNLFSGKEEDIDGERAKGYLFNGDYMSHICLVNKYVKENQHTILVAEEFFNDSIKATIGILSDLELVGEGLDADKINQNKGGASVYPWVNTLLSTSRKTPDMIKQPLRRILGPKNITKIKQNIKKFNTRKENVRSKMSEQLQNDLFDYFLKKNKGLSSLVKTNISWVKNCC